VLSNPDFHAAREAASRSDRHPAEVQLRGRFTNLAVRQKGNPTRTAFPQSARPSWSADGKYELERHLHERLGDKLSETAAQVQPGKRGPSAISEPSLNGSTTSTLERFPAASASAPRKPFTLRHFSRSVFSDVRRAGIPELGCVDLEVFSQSMSVCGCSSALKRVNVPESSLVYLASPQWMLRNPQFGRLNPTQGNLAAVS